MSWKNAIVIGALLAVLLLVFGIGYKMGSGRQSVSTETVIEHDTTRVEVPVEVTRYVNRERLVYVPVNTTDTLHIHDTTYIVLPREVAEYRDSNYYARVSGISPSLDYIETYNTTITNTVVQRKRWGFSVGAGVAVIWSPFSGRVEAGPGLTAGFTYTF